MVNRRGVATFLRMKISMFPAEIVKQQTDSDCFLCCVAMALAVPYETLCKRIGDLVKPIQVRGSYDADEVVVLTRMGLTEHVHYIRLIMMPQYAQTPFLRNVLWGRRAIIAVASKNNRDGKHAIYWDGNELHDPSNREIYSWGEVHPISMIIFQEVS